MNDLKNLLREREIMSSLGVIAFVRGQWSRCPMFTRRAQLTRETDAEQAGRRSGGTERYLWSDVYPERQQHTFTNEFIIYRLTMYSGIELMSF